MTDTSSMGPVARLARLARLARMASLAVLALALAAGAAEVAPVAEAPAATRVADVVVRLDRKVPMDDGVRLSANLFLPADAGSFPTILYRSPYGKGGAGNGEARAWAAAGYACVMQDTRGRFGSEGVFDPFRDEARDGAATVAWVRAQPWSNGKVGMAGGSYVGFVQWLAASAAKPGLYALSPMVTLSDFHDDVAYVGGAFQLALALGWGAMVSSPPGENILGKAWPGILRTLPLRDYAELLGRRIDFYDAWLDHPDDGEYWRVASVTHRYGAMSVPALNVGNWYDIFAKATTENFRRMREEAPTEEARRAQRLIMGAGAHGPPGPKIGERELGETAKIDIAAIERRWFARWLQGEKNGVDDEPPVKIFVMGTNRWRDEREWPLARTRFTPWYLRGGGKANTLEGDGKLSLEAPGDEPPDSYRYDPNDPVPTAGGANLLLAPIGSFDQRKVEERPDVLVYTSEPMERSLEVTGPVTLTLFASSSAPDTDFTAKLVDVDEEGRAWNLCDGIIRARYREGDTKQKPIEPGKVHEYSIDLWVTSNVFLPGHRIRLEVSSSNFPRFDRNPNTGRPFARHAEVAVAEQRVYHTGAYPSRLVLPVIPEAE